MKRLTTTLFLCLIALALTACSQDAPDNGPAPTEEAAPAEQAMQPSPALAEQLLARIDAEPIMLWLSLEPLPQALLDQLWARMALTGELSQEAYEDAAEEIDDPLGRALIRELGELDSAEAWAERGIEIAGVAGLHTVGIYPFMHWQLSDRAAFEATLERIEAEAGIGFTRKTVDSETLIWHDLGQVAVAIHHDDAFMTAALIPERPELMRRVANLDQAATAMTLDQVHAFNSERGFRNDSAGYIDFQRLLNTLLTGDDEMLVAARSEGELSMFANDPACQQEMRSLTGIFPRQSFGTTDATDRSMTILTRLETSADFGQSLAALADTPMSLDIERRGMVSTAMSLNLVAARDFGRDLVAGWIENPPQCMLFSSIAENAAEWQLALNQPIPPLVTNMHGLRLQIDEMTLENGQLDDAMGTLALFMRNPQMMVGMAQMFSPELAALNLTPGSGPQELPPGLVPNLEGVSAWLGLSDNALGMAIGSSEGLTAALEPGEPDSRIFSAGVDLAAYAELVKLGLSALPDGPADEIDTAETDEAMALMASIYQYVYKAVHLGEPGIDLVLRFDLAD
ncbi:MAG: hypothetical protein V2J20_07925 [Wenzhouxiangella sp.]|jgi:hypothetical protein|nr:hypothetical protein [Wenzhouxiangella sp.]